MSITQPKLAGFFSVLGPAVHAIGDGLLLASKASRKDHPMRQSLATPQSDAEKMAARTQKCMRRVLYPVSFPHRCYFSASGRYLSYAPRLIFVIIASILYSIAIASGGTPFPIRMSAIHPITMTIVWFAVKRILPQFVRD